jgi:hypothetical protein
VLVEGDTGTPSVAAEKLVVIEDRMLPPASLSEGAEPSDALARADLILVPGTAHAEHFERRYAGNVIACGIARLAAVWRDAEGERTRVRHALRIPQTARLALYAPIAAPGDSGVDLLGDDIAWMGQRPP